MLPGEERKKKEKKKRILNSENNSKYVRLGGCAYVRGEASLRYARSRKKTDRGRNSKRHNRGFLTEDENTDDSCGSRVNISFQTNSLAEAPRQEIKRTISVKES